MILIYFIVEIYFLDFIKTVCKLNKNLELNSCSFLLKIFLSNFIAIQ